MWCPTRSLINICPAQKNVHCSFLFPWTCPQLCDIFFRHWPFAICTHHIFATNWKCLIVCGCSLYEWPSNWTSVYTMYLPSWLSSLCSSLAPGAPQSSCSSLQYAQAAWCLRYTWQSGFLQRMKGHLKWVRYYLAWAPLWSIFYQLSIMDLSYVEMMYLLQSSALHLIFLIVFVLI